MPFAYLKIRALFKLEHVPATFLGIKPSSVATTTAIHPETQPKSASFCAAAEAFPFDSMPSTQHRDLCVPADD